MYSSEGSYKNESVEVVDLRSDTITKPTEGMYRKIQEAHLGDDGLDGDPTAVELEEFSADLLGKQAGLFVPTCTMANLLAVLAQSQRGEQVVLEQNAHMYKTEHGTAMFTNVCLRTVPGSRGMMDLAALKEILLGDRNGISTSQICLETSHNSAGGTVPSLEYMQTVHDLAQENSIKVHLDGARMFNAAAALGARPSDITRCTDTAAICLSKGLCAPMGAVLVGPEETIARARVLRRLLGGTQRQVGIVAAAGLEALKVMPARLHEDHARAKLFSAAINAENGSLIASIPETNIVQVDVSKTGRSSDEWINVLAQSGVLVRRINTSLIRCVTHRHLDDAAVERAAAIFVSLT